MSIQAVTKCGKGKLNGNLKMSRSVLLSHSGEKFVVKYMYYIQFLATFQISPRSRNYSGKCICAIEIVHQGIRVGEREHIK